MNNYDNFFNNLFPLRPLFPFVQSVLPTVFDDSLSYLETLGKVVKALNDTESNVNTLEQAVRAFADDLALYGNLTISPVEITYNQETGRYTASMTYSDIVAAIEEGHTMVLHVVDDLHDVEYYTATLKTVEISGVKMFYWESPAYTVNDVTVFYEAFINQYDSAGVTTQTINGSGSGAFIIHYDSETETADKTFSEIVAAIEAEKAVALIADRHYIGSAQWTTTGNDQQGYEIISVSFTAGSVISAQTGYNWASVTYAVDNANTWSVDRHGFPDATRVNALIAAQIAELDGFNSIKKLIYNETTGEVVYNDGENSTPVTGEYVALNFLSNQKIYVVLESDTTASNAVCNQYAPLRYRCLTANDIGVQFYRVFNGNIEVVTLPPNSSVAQKITTPIRFFVDGTVLYDTVQTLTDQQKARARDNIGADSIPLILNVTENNGVFTVDKTAAEIRANLHNLALTFGLNEGVYIDSYNVYGSAPYTICVFTVADPSNNSVSYIEYDVAVYLPGYAPSEAEDVPTVTRYLYTHNVGGGSLPDTTNASAGDFLRLDANKNAVWETVPAAESNSFGGA